MAFCKYMKMITLPKLRDSLREMKVEVKVSGRDRRARPGPDRAHGRDRLTVRGCNSPALTDRVRSTITQPGGCAYLCAVLPDHRA